MLESRLNFLRVLSLYVLVCRGCCVVCSRLSGRANVASRDVVVIYVSVFIVRRGLFAACKCMGECLNGT